MALYLVLNTLLLFTLTQSSSSSSGSKSGFDCRNTDCEECSGGVIDITFTNIGETATCTLFDEKNRVRYGPQTLNPGESIRASDPDLGKEMEIDCGGSRTGNIHLSCSQPVFVGLIVPRVDLQVTAGASRGGGNLCVEEPECECEGGVSAITFINRGPPANCVVNDDKASPRNQRVFVGTGETFGAVANPDDDKFSGDIEIDCGGSRTFELHTSCSQPVDIGTFYPDVQLEIFDGASRKNGLFCNSPSLVPFVPPSDNCNEFTGNDECSENSCCYDDADKSCNTCLGEECQECCGGLTYIKFENLGSKTLCVIYDKENDTKYAKLLNTGDEISVRGNGSYGTFGDFLHVDCGTGKCEYICTDCSQDLFSGIVLEKANLEVVESASRFGGRVCDTPKQQGPCECKGGVTELTFINRGGATSCYVEGEERSPTFNVGNGETFSVSGFKKDGKFKSNIEIVCSNNREAELHTSCSQPIYIGLTIPGTQLEIFDGQSRESPLCVGPERD